MLAGLAATATNRLVSLLRNHENLRLSREEFRHSRISFSQYGEDLALLRWVDEELIDVPKTYVDAGCFHPIRASNTLLLHKRGWRGVNIDLLPAKIKVFEQLRPEDTNVVAVLSDHTGPTEIATFASSYDDGIVGATVAQNPTGHFTATSRTLNDVLSGTPLNRQPIGYLNIDCEGHDLEVLRGLDLHLYRPTIVTIEAFKKDLPETKAYLEGAGYELKERLFVTQLFVRTDAPRVRPGPDHNL